MTDNNNNSHGLERRNSWVKLEHRLTLLEEADKLLVEKMDGLTNGFNSFKEVIETSVITMQSQIGINANGIKGLRARPLKILKISLIVIAIVGGILTAILNFQKLMPNKTEVSAEERLATPSVRIDD